MTKASDDWTACDPQEITNLAARLRGRRQLRAATRAAAVVAATTATAAIVAMVVWSLPRTDGGPDFAGISCQRVGELAGAFTNNQLPPDLQDQVRRHVALCRNCRDKIDALPAVSRHHHNDAEEPLPHRTLVLARHGSAP